jgi:hypothetical protein
MVLAPPGADCAVPLPSHGSCNSVELLDAHFQAQLGEAHSRWELNEIRCATISALSRLQPGQASQSRMTSLAYSIFLSSSVDPEEQALVWRIQTLAAAQGIRVFVPARDRVADFVRSPAPLSEEVRKASGIQRITCGTKSVLGQLEKAQKET